MGLGVKKTQCERWIETTESGVPNYEKGKKNKEVYPSLEAALKTCEKLNATSGRTHMVEPYTCNVCKKIHIGRSGKKIGEEYRAELAKKIEEINTFKNMSLEQRILNADLKVVGKIDLSRI